VGISNHTLPPSKSVKNYLLLFQSAAPGDVGLNPQKMRKNPLFSKVLWRPDPKWIGFL